MCDRRHVGHVIEVAMRDENEVGIDFLGLGRCRGTVVEVRIE